MTDTNYYAQVVTPDDECAKHGKKYILLALHLKTRVMEIDGVPQNEGDPLYICWACLQDALDTKIRRIEELEKRIELLESEAK